MVRENKGERKVRRDQGRTGEEPAEAQQYSNNIIKKEEAKTVEGPSSDSEDLESLSDGFVKLDLDEELEKELTAQFGEPKTPSKVKEQVPEPLSSPDSSDDVKKDLERLQQIRAKREADRISREAIELEEKSEKYALLALGSTSNSISKKSQAEIKTSKYPEIAEAIEKLLGKEGGKLSLNQLNQNADAKKLLKPLLKKNNVKQLNKATLKDVCEYKGSKFVMSEINMVVYVQLKS